MKNRTFRIIVILMSLLFLNIEAAQAGLVHKLKLYIRHEFPDNQFVYITVSLLLLGFLAYVIFTPVLIGKQKWSWLNYYTYNPGRHAFQHKKSSVKKIARILQPAEFVKEAHS